MNVTTIALFSLFFFTTGCSIFNDEQSDSSVSETESSSLLSSSVASSALEISSSTTTLSSHGSEPGNSSGTLSSNESSTEYSSPISAESSSDIYTQPTNHLDSLTDVYIEKVLELRIQLGSRTGACQDDDTECIEAYNAFKSAQSNYEETLLNAQLTQQIQYIHSFPIQEITDSTIVIVDSTTTCNTETMEWEINEIHKSNYYTLHDTILGLANSKESCRQSTYSNSTGTLFDTWSYLSNSENPYADLMMCPQPAPIPPYYLESVYPTKLRITQSAEISVEKKDLVNTIEYNCFFNDYIPEKYFIATNDSITLLENSCNTRIYRDSLGRKTTQHVEQLGNRLQTSITEEFNNHICTVSSNTRFVFNSPSVPQADYPDEYCDMELMPDIGDDTNENRVFTQCMRKLLSDWNDASLDL